MSFLIASEDICQGGCSLGDGLVVFALMAGIVALFWVVTH